MTYSAFLLLFLKNRDKIGTKTIQNRQFTKIQFIENQSNTIFKMQGTRTKPVRVHCYYKGLKINNLSIDYF